MKDVKKEFDIVYLNVAKILHKYTRARNEDKFLLFIYWTEIDNVNQVTLDSLSRLTMPESIRRCRQKIQSEGKYLPTVPEVLTQRRIRESLIREYFKNDKWVIEEWQKRRYGVK